MNRVHNVVNKEGIVPAIILVLTVTAVLIASVVDITYMLSVLSGGRYR